MTPPIAANLWEMMHGGSTHLPIALMLVSAVSDGLGCLIKTDPVRDRFHVAGFIMLIAGTLGAFPAVLSGLMLARWETGGAGALFWHHAFLWPAFGLLIGLSVWRIIVRGKRSRTGLFIYLLFAFLAALLVSGAGFWGGEILLGSS